MNKQQTISIEKIRPNTYQPRRHFDEDKLLELAQSIRENGLIQPVVVREKDHEYEIIAGERRYRAMMMIGYMDFISLERNYHSQRVLW